MIRAILAAVAIALAALPSSAAPGDSSAPAGAGAPEAGVRSAYEALRDAMYNSEPLQQLLLLHEQALRAVDQATLAPADDALWRSRIEYMLARGYQACSEDAAAVAHYEKGLNAAETALAQGPVSEGWRMVSEHIGQLCLLKGLGFLLANGRKVVACAEKALELDPRNAAAQVIVAASKVYPPPVFGGNPRLGIELMHKALAMGSAERDDLFNIYSGIGFAYDKLKNAEEARRWMRKALDLYPGNLFVRGEYEKLGGSPGVPGGL